MRALRRRRRRRAQPVRREAERGVRAGTDSVRGPRRAGAHRQSGRIGRADHQPAHRRLLVAGMVARRPQPGLLRPRGRLGRATTADSVRPRPVDRRACADSRGGSPATPSSRAPLPITSTGHPTAVGWRSSRAPPAPSDSTCTIAQGGGPPDRHGRRAGIHGLVSRLRAPAHPLRDRPLPARRGRRRPQPPRPGIRDQRVQGAYLETRTA